MSRPPSLSVGSAPRLQHPVAASSQPIPWGERVLPYLLIAPAFLIVAAFTLYPVGKAVWSSLLLESPFFPPEFVGLQNYIDVVTGVYFWTSLRVTITFTLLSVVATLVLGTATAVLLSQRFFGVGVLKPIALLPWAVPAAVAGILWKAVFADSWGALNAVLYLTGLADSYTNWLGDRTWALIAAVIAHVWTQLPLAVIFILTAMQSIPKSIYEAAEIDGASPARQFFSITLPNIRVILVVVAVYGTLMGLSAYDVVYSLTHGGPGTATTVISYFTWAETFRMWNFGGGAALSVLIGLISLVFVVVFMRLIPADAILSQKGGR